MSGGLTPTFHQEMLNYHLSPSYEYQEPIWQKYRADQNKEKKTVNGLGKALWFMSSLYLKRYRMRKSVSTYYHNFNFNLTTKKQMNRSLILELAVFRFLEKFDLETTVN